MFSAVSQYAEKVNASTEPVSFCGMLMGSSPRACCAAGKARRVCWQEEYFQHSSVGHGWTDLCRNIRKKGLGWCCSKSPACQAPLSPSVLAWLDLRTVFGCGIVEHVCPTGTLWLAIQAGLAHVGWASWLCLLCWELGLLPSQGCVC